MKNEFENSDKRLQEKLEGFRMAAPEGAWAGIEGNIGGKSDRRGGFFYLWIALLFIGVTGAGVFTFIYMSNDTDAIAAQSSKVAENASSTNQDLTASNQNVNSNSANQNRSDHAASNTNPEGLISGNKTDNTGNSNNKVADGSNTSSKKNSSASDATILNNTTRKSNSKDASTSGDKSISSKTNSSKSDRKVINADDETIATSDKSMSKNNDESLSDNENESGKTTDHVIVSTTNQATAHETEGKGDSDEARTVTKSDSAEMDSKANPTEVAHTASQPQIPTSMPDPDADAKASWSIETGIDVSSFNMNHTANSSSLQQFLNGSYSQNFAQAAFLRLNYQPFQRFSFHTGLEYAQNKATQDYSWLTTISSFQYDTVGYYFDSITQQQLPIIDSVETISQIENQEQYRSVVSQVYIPFGAMFHIPFGRKSELGVNLSGLVGIRTGSTGEILFDENGNTISSMEAYRQINFSARATLRYSYFLGMKSAVYVEPYFGFGLNDRSNTTLPFGSRFRNSGVRVGFRYTF